MIEAPSTGCFSLGVLCDGGARLYVNGRTLIDNWAAKIVTVDSALVQFRKGCSYNLELDYHEHAGGASILLGIKPLGRSVFRKAVAAAKRSDVVVVYAGTSSKCETEGRDRLNLSLPGYQDILIKRIAAANKNTIVVMISGSPVLMGDWLGKVAGVVQAWFGGDEGGRAIADVLFGKYDPSGKLPMTFPRRWSDCAAYGSYRKQDSVSAYREGIFVGYRYFDKNGITPLFPFGYGLSYTSFSYSGIVTRRVGKGYEVSFRLKNSGGIRGVEVAELYVHDVSQSPSTPVKELKRFARISLRPGQTKEVTFMLNKNDFAHFDTHSHHWVTQPGLYDILIGRSSRDIRLRGRIKIG